MVRWVARVAVVVPAAGAAAHLFTPAALLAAGVVLAVAALPFVAPDPPAPGRG